LGAYADQIAKLKLVQLLEKSGGRDDVSETDVTKLHAAVLDAADIAGPLLERIPVTFRQYTEHNIGHSRNLISLMGKFIPTKTQKILNALEIAVLLLAAILHDLGMFVTDAERTEFLGSDEFERFLNADPEKEQAISDARAAGKHVTARAIEDAVLADYFRKFHPERARKHIEEHLGPTLRFREYSLVDAVARICESHGWGVFESTDGRHPEKTIANLKPDAAVYDVPFNEQYIAAVLRLADIMDLDRSRTPLALLKTIDFTEARSQAEWQKHLQIKGWRVTEREVVFQAECRKPEHYVAVMDFLEWIDAELRDCRRLLVAKASKDIAERYLFHLPPAVDRTHVEMADKSFIAGAFRFELDYERIMKLLMDRSLYPDPSLFLRELLQNSLDACRVRTAHARYENAEAKYEPIITVWDRSQDPNPTIVFQDNGIGMSRATIENYFIRVGRSYYRSNEFHAERKRLLERGVELEATSQFGIGFLSCFMVADRIVVETFRSGQEPLRIEIEGPTKYFTMQMVQASSRPEFLSQGCTAAEDGPPTFPGTRLTLFLRPNQEMNVIQTLKTFAVNIEVPTTIIAHGEATRLATYRWHSDPVTWLQKYLETHDDVWTCREWSSLLTSVDVPLGQYEFCSNFDGRAWFWFLRDRLGRPQPRVGWLTIGTHISIVGKGQSMERLVSTVRLHQVNATSGELPMSVSEELRALWRNSSVEMRERYVAASRYHGARSWYEVDGVPTSLYREDDAWLASEFHSGQTFSLSYPQRFALHGIALPAGITKWEPMVGHAETIDLLPCAGGFWIDVRKHAPRPAANRLFWAPDDAQSVGVSLLRAYIQRAIELLSENEGVEWQRWAEECVSSFRGEFYFDEAMSYEHARVESCFQYRLRTPDGVVRVTMDDLRARFGRWVPFEPQRSKLQIRLDASDPINHVLLYNRPEEDRDGVHVVDLEMTFDP
jgi:hypothetical protein